MAAVRPPLKKEVQRVAWFQRSRRPVPKTTRLQVRHGSGPGPESFEKSYLRFPVRIQNQPTTGTPTHHHPSRESFPDKVIAERGPFPRRTRRPRTSWTRIPNDRSMASRRLTIQSIARASPRRRSGMKHQPNLQNTDPSPAESFSKTSNRELGLTCASFLTQSRVNCRGTMLTEFNKTANNPPAWAGLRSGESTSRGPIYLATDRFESDLPIRKRSTL